MGNTSENTQDEITYTQATPNNNAGQVKNTTETNTSEANSDSKAKVISHPNDVAALVMSQMNTVNNKKDELTIAIKSLTDTTSQLVNAYANNMKAIQELSKRVKELEGKSGTLTP